MKGEWNIYIDETLSEKDTLWFCVLYQHNWKYAEMFEKVRLMICCFENLPIMPKQLIKTILWVLFSQVYIMTKKITFCFFDKEISMNCYSNIQVGI